MAFDAHQAIGKQVMCDLLERNATRITLDLGG